MPKIKLEGLAQPFEALGQGFKTGQSALKDGVLGVTAVATTGVGAATAGLNTGLTGVFSLGKGFRDFILRGTVVELAVAVVLGSAFTKLIESATSDFITPLIAAIFAGSNFADLYFEINGSKFKYGDFINAFLTFIFVIMVLYFCVVIPLEKLQFAAFKHRAILRDCPFCWEEISMAATRCKHCAGEVPLTEEMQRTLEMATAAIDAAEERRQHRWYRRIFSPCTKCCCKPKQAMVHESADGEAKMTELAEGASTAMRVLSPRISLSMQRDSSGSSFIPARQHSSRFASPQQSFSGAAVEGAQPSTAIDIEPLVREQPKDK